MTTATDNERPENAPPEGQDHLGPTPDAALNGLPDQIDIEIADQPAEGAESVEPPAPAEQRPIKRPRNDPQRRIDQAVAKQRAAETQAQRLDRENRELLAKLEGSNKTTEAERQRAELGERAALVHHKEVQTLKQREAQRDLQAAIETGDAAKQADATARLSAAAAGLREVENWEATHPAPAPKPADKPAEAAPRAEQRPEPQRQEPTPLAEPARAFIDENPWFNPGTREAPNPDFDAEMRDELVNYANSYERRLTVQGKKAEINTEPYFDKLRQHMRTEFPDYDWDDDAGGVVPAIEASRTPPTRQLAAQRPNGRMPQMTRDNAVLPANGQAAPGAKPANNRLQVQMSDDEKQLAIGQWENGAMGNHFKTGKPVATRQEAVEQWAYRKALNAKNGRAA